MESPASPTTPTSPSYTSLFTHDYTNRSFHEAFELGTELGSGGFSVVHKCREKTSGNEFAVKCVDKAKHPPAAMTALEREAKIMSELDHPILARGGLLFNNQTHGHMMMEMVEGGELFYKLVELKNYTELTASRCVRNILEGLAHMHAQGVVHRDLKPENILLQKKASESESDDSHLTHIKIVDFGFAERFEQGKKSFTQACGTPNFIAPEIVKVGIWKKGDFYDEKCDVWGIGIITYILLSGKYPFFGDSVDKILKSVTKGVFDFKRKIWEGITDTAKDFITKLLTVDPDKRPSAAEALRHPWISNIESLANTDLRCTKHLMETVENLKTFNAKEKLRGVMFAMTAMTRLLKKIQDEEAQAASAIQRVWRQHHQHHPHGEASGTNGHATPAGEKKAEAPPVAEVPPPAAEGPAPTDSSLFQGKTVAELRKHLKSIGLPTAGRKTELLDRLSEYERSSKKQKV